MHGDVGVLVLEALHRHEIDGPWRYEGGAPSGPHLTILKGRTNSLRVSPRAPTGRTHMLDVNETCCVKVWEPRGGLAKSTAPARVHTWRGSWYNLCVRCNSGVTPRVARPSTDGRCRHRERSKARVRSTDLLAMARSGRTMTRLHSFRWPTRWEIGRNDIPLAAPAHA